MPTAINKQILTFDTSVARPRNFQIFRGETVVIECALTNYINPIDLTGMTASAYWRSKAMAEESSDLWYIGTVEIVNKKAVWTWESSNDDGSDGYEWFIKVTDANNFSYRAFGHIEMLGSPSINPSVGPVPQTNYYTKDETDAQIYQATEHLVPDTREINGHALNADVNLTASDVGALPDTYVAPVTSVNGETGAVSLTASDVGALPDTYTAPVASVNTKTGAVTLTASDVGALPDTYVAPVASVNNKTGTVSLTASDVGAATLSDIPPVDATPTSGSTNPVSSNGVYDALQTKVDSSALATVATTGSYTDLSNKPTIPEVVAPTSEATTGQAADAEATWTSLSGLDDSITQARIQMALEDGAFALPQTVVKWNTGIIDVLDISGDVTNATLDAVLDYSHGFTSAQVPVYVGIGAISFGQNVTSVTLGPKYTLSNGSFDGTQEEIDAAFTWCDTHLNGCSKILMYNHNLKSSFAMGSLGNRINRYCLDGGLMGDVMFYNWTNLEEVYIEDALNVTVGVQCFDGCTNLKVVDYRKALSLTTPRYTRIVGNRVRTITVPPQLNGVNPNLKIVVPDAQYTTMIASSTWAAWHPYLVKASDWEYVHHSELADYATSTDVSTAISTATSGLVDQTALTTAISSVEAEIPDVVSPYTNDSSGKAADAQDTGNALKTKATSFQPYRISNCVIQDNYWHNIRMFLDETNEIGIVFDGTGFVAFGWPDDTVQYDTSYDGFDDILSVDKNGTIYNYSVYYSVVATLKDIPSLAGYATETYVDNQIAAAVGTINTALDTINGEVI